MIFVCCTSQTNSKQLFQGLVDSISKVLARYPKIERNSNLMVQVRQGSINFRCKTGMPGVGKIFCHQPFCEVPSPPSRYVWNLICIRHIYKCISTMSPTICHWTATAKESTRGGAMSPTVIINWSITSPTECSSSLLINIGIPHIPLTAPVYDHISLH